jgi:predicted homoserine dehydrogenase-like protein
MSFYPGSFPEVVDMEQGVKLGGVAVTASAAELNLVDGVAAPTADGLGLVRVARATYDFAEHGGAIGAIGLGVTLPNKAIVIGGFIDVVTTCTTAAADAGTMAVSIQSANDIVTATAVSAGGDIWDAGKRAIIPKNNTPESTGIKCTAAREITATIATQAFTAGKFVVFLNYVISD